MSRDPFLTKSGQGSRYTFYSKGCGTPKPWESIVLLFIVIEVAVLFRQLEKLEGETTGTGLGTPPHQLCRGSTLSFVLLTETPVTCRLFFKVHVVNEISYSFFRHKQP